MKQHNLSLPFYGYVLAINDENGKPFGLYPLMSGSPQVFPSRAKARRIKLRHERVVRVKIEAVK